MPFRDACDEKSQPKDKAPQYWFMRDRMRPDDRVLIYHSNAKPHGVAGLARVCSATYPDPRALDPASSYYDSRSSADDPVWFLVDVCFEEKFPRLISWAEMRTDPALEGMALLRKGQRLPVMPVEPAHFARILALSG
ncbi:MAG: EVE domain-containing protein [Deltaproteobacteria bacterium]|nr:MAG: EVE domain-containing protein [Deltaproteobacteria bacterium]